MFGVDGPNGPTLHDLADAQYSLLMVTVTGNIGFGIKIQSTVSESFRLNDFIGFRICKERAPVADFFYLSYAF